MQDIWIPAIVTIDQTSLQHIYLLSTAFKQNEW